MISWISSWAQGIIMAVIIGAIIEMILPEGNSKKYVKIVIGVYVLFTIISPVISKITGKTIQVSDILELNKYIEETENNSKLYVTLDEDNSNNIKDIYEKLEYTFQKIGVVKYDAFHEMGGKLSFALCMLDKKDNGYVVNVMHSNDGCFAYIKEIVNGKSYIELGKEEEKAVKQALAGRMGDEELSKEINDLMQKDKM